MTTEEFIRQHENDDVATLALKAARGGEVDVAFALRQIAGRQRARKKLPRWAATEGILYPPPLSMEQCSSEATAAYKAALVARCQPQRMVDLTGGFGVDFSYLARGASEAVYVERQETLCQLALHNLPLLGLGHAEVVCADATDYLTTMPPADLIYIDPARRDDRGGRTFAIEDCTPNILAWRDTLLEKAPTVLVKLSPMLDWRAAAQALGEAVTEVHIVAAGHECKELLLWMERTPRPLTVVCKDDDYTECFSAGSVTSDLRHWAEVRIEEGRRRWLLEPYAPLMKAGFFAVLETRYGVRQIAANSHLFIAEDEEKAVRFPGRCFEIEGMGSLNKKELKRLLQGVSRAQISVRNFPLKAEELRKRLRLADGGDTCLFATTLPDGSHVIIRGKRGRFFSQQ